MAEIGDDVFRAGVIAETGRRAAPHIDDRGRQIELLAVARDVPIAPGDPAAASEIARVGTVEGHAVARALAYLERHGNPAGGIRGLPDLDADRAEDAEPEQILARLLDVARAVGIAGMNEETPAYA